MPELRIEPATRASSFDDLQLVLGTRGGAAACQCQRAVLPLREWWYMPREERKSLLRREIGKRRAAPPGLLAYLDDEPVGWCRVGPRCQFAPLRNSRVPWAGRDEDKEDGDVWSAVCFVVRAGFRKRGISYALAAAAVELARSHGAVALEGYPMDTADGEITWGELHVGAVGAFRQAGFDEVSRPSKRRYVMRIEFPSKKKARARR
jgi:GNAT superfamily N-acetyltransferase